MILRHFTNFVLELKNQYLILPELFLNSLIKKEISLIKQNRKDKGSQNPRPNKLNYTFKKLFN